MNKLQVDVKRVRGLCRKIVAELECGVGRGIIGGSKEGSGSLLGIISGN